MAARLTSWGDGSDALLLNRRIAGGGAGGGAFHTVATNQIERLGVNFRFQCCYQRLRDTVEIFLGIFQ